MSLGVAEGTLAVLHVETGKIEVEVLPPSPEMERTARRLHEKYHDAFAELKHLATEATNYVSYAEVVYLHIYFDMPPLCVTRSLAPILFDRI